MKKTKSSRYFVLPFAVLFVSLLFITSDCTGKKGAVPEGETGSIFVKWSSGTFGGGSVAFTVKQTDFDCAANGTESVSADVFDTNGTLLAEGGPWSCGAGEGVVEHVPAGTWRMVVLSARSAAGDVLFAGAISNVSVAAGKTTTPPAASLNRVAQNSPNWAVTGSLIQARVRQTATKLFSGKVLVSGGEYWTGTVGNTLSGCEVYDPEGGVWNPTGAMTSPRSAHTATLLPDGKVLVAGGIYDGKSTNGCEIYDPVTEEWSATGSLNTPRCGHTATLLQNGSVIVTGGDNDANNWNPIASCEVYDPIAGSWTLLQSAMKVRRSGHRAVLLPDGRLIVVGGFAGSGSFTEICEALDTGDPGASWVLIDGLEQTKYGFTASLVVGNEVLIAGGNAWDTVAADCERLNPSTLAWSDASGLLHTRSAHTATVLGDGRVLVAGGFDGSGSISSCELYEPKGVPPPH